MTPCAIHGISLNLCGCATKPEDRPAFKSAVTHRDFSGAKTGVRVRFARALRVITKCPTCGLSAVPVPDQHLRRWPFREGGEFVERKARRIVYVHDATIDQAGYELGAACTVYEERNAKVSRLRRSHQGNGRSPRRPSQKGDREHGK